MKRILLVVKKAILFSITIFTIHQASAQTTLAAGDMAIIGCNRLVGTAPFELSIVSLVDISAGTTIYICDYPYASVSSGLVNLANTSEGAITWTTTSSISKGAVFLIKINAATNPAVVSGLPGTVSITGWSSANTTSTPAPAGGENWFIYQGSSPTTPSTYIYGWTNYFTTTFGSANNWLANGTQVATNTSTSELPPGLTNGTTAVSLAWSTASGGSHGDNNVYNNTQTGTKAALLAAISNYTNWNHDEVITYQLTTASAGTTSNSGNPFFNGASPAFNVTGTLPVTVLSFNAERKQHEQILAWHCVNEMNFKNYEIEKSWDGINFFLIGTMNVNATGYYQFAEEKTDLVNSYYRLKINDITGEYNYSNTIVLLAGIKNIQLSVYPNPALDMITVTSKDKIELITITNLQGVILKTITATEQNVINVPILDLPRGTYVVHALANKSDLIQKIIKQ